MKALNGRGDRYQGIAVEAVAGLELALEVRTPHEIWGAHRGARLAGVAHAVVVTPVEKPELCARLREILEVQLNDRRSAWDMQADGTYRQRRPVDDQDCRSAQEVLIELATQRQHDRRAAIGRPQALDQAR